MNPDTELAAGEPLMEVIPYVVFAIGVVVLLAMLHFRVMALEIRRTNDWQLWYEWRDCVSKELDLMRELAKNHEARIAELEKRP